ncbi:hypothetical protein D3C85_853320 [compost metagenome]
MLLRIDQVPEVELALAAVFAAELDVLLPAQVFHAQLVVGWRAQHVARVVAFTQRHVVWVLTVV